MNKDLDVRIDTPVCMLIDELDVSSSKFHLKYCPTIFKKMLITFLRVHKPLTRHTIATTVQVKVVFF